MTRRFKFGTGAKVHVIGDHRRQVRTIVKRVRNPPHGEWYWLDRLVDGMSLYNGGDLVRVKQ